MVVKTWRVVVGSVMTARGLARGARRTRADEAVRHRGAAVGPEVGRLLAAVRRRTRVAWAVATAGRVGIAAAALAFAVVALGRLRPAPWADPAALVVIGAAAAGLVGVALLLRLPTPVVARVADRGLATGDVFATALEVGQGPFAERVAVRADSLAAGRKGSEAVPVRPSWRWLCAGAAVGLAALALAVLPNHQDEIVRQRAAEQADARSAAAQVRNLAVGATRQGADPVVAARLLELARQLDASDGRKESDQAVQRAAADVAGQLRPQAAAERAAAVGLERTLGDRPLDPAGGSAAEQLRALAAGLASVDRAATADRLDRLAATQSVGNAAAAKALAAAADALRADDVAAAATSLGLAADAQAAAMATAASQAATADVLAELGSVAAAAQGEEVNEDEGEGWDEGGPEDLAQGFGQAPGQMPNFGDLGIGQGPPKDFQPPEQGLGGGGGGGQGGPNNRTAEGSTGSGGVSDGAGDHTAGPPPANNPTVYDPTTADGPDLATGGTLNEGPQGATVGKEAGPNSAGTVGVPLSDALPRYEPRATAALDRLDLPPSVRDLVRAYFDGLGGP